MTEKEYKKRLKNKFLVYRDKLNLPENVTFGIEIEYENIVNDTLSYLLDESKIFDKNLRGWKNKSEFDIEECNDIGEAVNGEVVSPIFKDNIRTWQSLKSILNLLYKNDAVITEKCAGQVNIGTHILGNNPIYWRNFFLLWLLYEEEIYKFSSGEYYKLRPDINNLFQNISSEIDLMKILDIKRKKYLHTLSDCLFDKFHEIYIHKIIKKEPSFGNRIEFRLPNCSLKEEIWQNYINFFVKFLLASKKKLDVDKTLYKIKCDEHSAVELADYIFDEKIDKDNFLIQTLKPNEIYRKVLSKHIIPYNIDKK